MQMGIKTHFVIIIAQGVIFFHTGAVNKYTETDRMACPFELWRAVLQQFFDFCFEKAAHLCGSLHARGLGYDLKS